MIKRGQIFVRAKDSLGKWGSADVLDLTEESFRAFVLGIFARHGMITSFIDDDNVEIELKTKYPHSE